MSVPVALVPTHRRAATGEPVLATQLPDGNTIGGSAVAAGWLCRWVHAIGGIATTTDGVNVNAGSLTVQPGQWLVYDFRLLTVMDDGTFQRDYVTDLHPIEGA